MAPATRASTKNTAIAEARDIVSWTSAVTGEILHYERFHVFDEEEEVLFVQLRATDDGELVPWTIDSEDEDEDATMIDDSHSEAGEADTDFVPEADIDLDLEKDTDFVLEGDTGFAPAAKRAQRRQTIKIKTTIPLPAPLYRAESYPTPFYQAPSYRAPSYHTPHYPAPFYHAPSYQTPFYHAPSYQALFDHAPSYSALSLSDLLLSATAVPVHQSSLPAARYSAAPTVDYTEEVVELEEGETILDLFIRPLSDAVLQRTSRCSLPSLLRNFRLSDLSEVNGANAHAIEKDFYDTIRPGRFRAHRWVLDPRHTIFRPSNPDYKELAGMGPY